MRLHRTALLIALAAVSMIASPLIGLTSSERAVAFHSRVPLIDAVAVDFPFEFVVADLRVTQLDSSDDADDSSDDSASDDSTSEDSTSEDSVSEDSASEDSVSEDSVSEDSASEDSTSASGRLGLARKGPQQKLKLEAMIWLAENSDGIDPANEELAVQFGSKVILQQVYNSIPAQAK